MVTTSTFRAPGAGVTPFALGGTAGLGGAAALPVTAALGATTADEPTAAERDAVALVAASADGAAPRSLRGARHARLVEARPAATATHAIRFERGDVVARSLLWSALMQRIFSHALALGAVIVLAVACTDGDGADDDSPESGARGGKSGNGGIGGKAGASGKGGKGGTGGTSGADVGGSSGRGGTAGQGGDVAQGGSSAHGGTAGQGGTAGGGNDCPTDFAAADGKSCAPEGKHCSSGSGPCEFGQFLTCTDGKWVHQEAFPDPNCGAGAGGQSGGGGQAGAGESSGGSAGETGGAGAGGA